MKDNTEKTIVTVIISANIIITLYIISCIIYMFCFNKLDVKEYKHKILNISRMEYTLTKEEAKTLIKDLYHTPHFYKETINIKSGRMAETYGLIRYVRIKKGLNLKDFVIAYAHELSHLMFMCADETTTQFKTFVMLYESGNAELQHIALRDAQDIINGKYRGTEYDCGFYILEYLNEKGENYGKQETFNQRNR